MRGLAGETFSGRDGEMGRGFERGMGRGKLRSVGGGGRERTRALSSNRHTHLERKPRRERVRKAMDAGTKYELRRLFVHGEDAR